MATTGIETAARVTDEQTLSLGVLAELLGFHIRRAQVMNFREFHRHVTDPDATPTQFAMLVLIEANPGLSQRDLGGMLDMDRATTMAVVDRLAVARWISKKRSTVDRRKHMLQLTEAGRRALAKMKQAVLELEQSFARGLTQRESRQLLMLIRKLCSSASSPGDEPADA